MSSVFIVVFYSAHSKTETKKFADIFFFFFFAGREFGSITLVIGGIEKFSFR